MGHIIRSSDIASFLKTNLQGQDIDITHVSSLNQIEENTLIFSKHRHLELKNYSNNLIIVPLDFEGPFDKLNYIQVDNPRLAFATVVEHFFVPKKKYSIHKYAEIADNCRIPETVSIGAFSCIGKNVTIGENTVINNNVVIYDNTIIGDNCYIKSGSIIGEDGFGFDFNKDGQPIRIHHLGKVIIGDNVEIGAKCTICRGTIGNTSIDEYVKIDDQVHIAHNCIIGKNTIITACAEISGSVTIGRQCWIGPNSSIIQKVVIGDNVTIGIGTIINKDVTSNKKIMGLSGLGLKELIKLKRRIKYGE